MIEPEDVEFLGTRHLIGLHKGFGADGKPIVQLFFTSDVGGRHYFQNNTPAVDIVPEHEATAFMGKGAAAMVADVLIVLGLYLKRVHETYQK